MKESLLVHISESSQVGEARRAALSLANRLNFGETARGKIGIVVTEIANNLVQHAHGGVVLLRSIEQDSTIGIEILALDQGAGMANINACLQDGFSTAGTPGNGLGAIRRLSDQFEIYSIPNQGTAIAAQLWSGSPPPSPKPEIGVVCLPKWGEEVSGDAWASYADSQRCLFLVADGLGHGPEAAEASLKAVRIFHEQHQRSPQAILEAAHPALRNTRGAALAIAEVDFAQPLIRFAGIGNITASIFSLTEHRHLISHNGTIGHEVRRIQEFIYPWSANSLLIMHSDGLSSKWQLDRYPGLSQKHPSLIAGVLYRDFNRERDDATVLVARGMGE